MDVAPNPHSRRTQRLVPAITTLVIVLGGIGYLFYSSAGEAFEYYKHVDEVARDPGAWNGKHLQMHGFVVPGSTSSRGSVSFAPPGRPRM